MIRCARVLLVGVRMCVLLGVRMCVWAYAFMCEPVSVLYVAHLHVYVCFCV